MLISRRHFLTLAGSATAGVAIGACTASTGTPSSLPASSTVPGAGAAPGTDLELAMRSQPGTFDFSPGSATPVWRYTAEVLAGDPTSVEQGSGYLGPTLRVSKGSRVRVNYENLLPEESIIHWHGLDVPADMDGHPRFAVGEGGTYTYEYTVRNRAGTY